jgi:DNA-binding protein HU-beta
MNKTDLIKGLVKNGFSSKDATKAVNLTLKTIMEGVAAKKRITLLGFGTFKASERKARRCRAPGSKVITQVPAQTVPSFKAGKDFKNLMK